ncbi:MAG TPA: hypothetical protein VKZ99_08810 [Gammaproteobacteria bacterium]|nr:hypothetical protein [Gammaproteobacteria bacterium]
MPAISSTNRQAHDEKDATKGEFILSRDGVSISHKGVVHVDADELVRSRTVSDTLRKLGHHIPERRR